MITLTYFELFFSIFAASILVDLADYFIISNYKKSIKVSLTREDFINLFKGAFFSNDVIAKYLIPELGFEMDLTDRGYSMNMNFDNPKWNSVKLSRLHKIYNMREKL